MMAERCGDNRFEIIKKAKEELLESTNIDTSKDEMKVIDNFLFRCWQMGWLERYDKPREPLDIPTMTTEFIKEHGLPCPDGYEFQDENGNVINTQKIVLKKKKPKYPKTYEECCYVLGFENTELVFEDDYRNINPPKEQWKRLGLMNQLNKLLICRDAYWKIAGDWKPDWAMYSGPKHCIIYSDNQIKWQGKSFVTEAKVLAFPTKEMRDAFKENFDPDIENCKEFL